MSVIYTLKLLVIGPQLNTPIPKTFIVDEIDFSNIATEVIFLGIISNWRHLVTMSTPSTMMDMFWKYFILLQDRLKR